MRNIEEEITPQSDTLQDHIARHLKQKIACEENPGAKTVDRVAEA